MHRPGARQGATGFVLPFVMALAAALLLAATMLVTMGNSGLFGAFSQARTKDARQAAEQGMDVIINTLNASPNRKLLVANVPMGSWGDSSNAARVGNPCNNSGPTTAAKNLGKSQEVAIAGDPTKKFFLKRITLRNPDRLASYSSSGDPLSPATSGSTVGSYSVSAIDIFPSQPKPGYIELVVEGRIYDAAGNLKSTAQVTREFVVIPKCCRIGFTVPYGSESQDLCQVPPTLVLGFTSGNYQFTPSTGVDRITASIIQTTSWDVSGVSPYTGSTRPSGLTVKNDLLYCAKTTSGCNDQNIFSSTTTRLPNLGLTALPSAPDYPTGLCSGSLCNQGFAIDNQPSATNDYTKLDYIRVDPTGTFVQMCDANTQATTSTSQDVQSLFTNNSGFNSSCTSATSSINNYCVRTSSTSSLQDIPAFYCRISSMILRDLRSATAGNQSVSNRRQNNTLWIDTTRGYIYLYITSPWATANPITLTYTGNDAYSDGQIQHVNCRDRDGVLPDTYKSQNVCASEALPKYWPWAMIYSNLGTTLRIGDDGYIRGLRLFLPAGTVQFDYPEGCRPPLPVFSGILWTDNLRFTQGTASPCSSAERYLADILVPKGGTILNTSSFVYPPPYEWVARGSTYTSLF